jgi:hypothetical protein
MVNISYQLQAIVTWIRCLHKIPGKNIHYPLLMIMNIISSDFLCNGITAIKESGKEI